MTKDTDGHSGLWVGPAEEPSQSRGSYLPPEAGFAIGPIRGARHHRANYRPSEFVTPSKLEQVIAPVRQVVARTTTQIQQWVNPA